MTICLRYSCCVLVFVAYFPQVVAGSLFEHYYEKGNDAFESGSLLSATTMYLSALESATTSREKKKALGSLSVCYEKQGHYTSARTTLEAMLSVDPKNQWALKKLGKLGSSTKKNKVLGLEKGFGTHGYTFDELRKIQEDLIFASNYNGMIDGEFGPITRRAIENFERKNNYVIDGNLSKNERYRLAQQAMQSKKDLKWKEYTHPTGFYKIGFIGDFLDRPREEEYGGMSFTNKHGVAFLRMYITSNCSEQRLQQLYLGLLDFYSKNNYETMYKVSKEKWFVISAYFNDNIHYSKQINLDDICIGFVVRFKYDNESTKDFSNMLTTATVNSFAVFPTKASKFSTWIRKSAPVDPPTYKTPLDPIGTILSSESELRLPMPDPIIGQKKVESLSAEEVYKSIGNTVWVVVASGDEGISQGSAIAIGDHHLLTNCHVLDVGEIYIFNKNLVADPIRAYVHSQNKKHDRCVLNVEKSLSYTAPIRPYITISVGEKAYTIGAPYGLDLTMAEGLISSKRSFDGIKYLQTSAPVSPGSSGGGLFDEYGNLLGVTTLIRKDAQNLNFAIPADDYWLE